MGVSDISAGGTPSRSPIYGAAGRSSSGNAKNQMTSPWKGENHAFDLLEVRVHRKALTEQDIKTTLQDLNWTYINFSKTKSQ